MVPDNEASPPDLPADNSAVAVIPSVQRSPQNTGTVQSLIDMEILGLKVAALLDTGAGASLIGDAIFEQCLKRRICMRQTSVKLQMASGLPTPAKGALRLCVTFNGMKRRHHFLYLPGLTVAAILGRDFIAGQRMVLDFDNGGYRLGSQGDLVPFSNGVQQTNSGAADVASLERVLPEPLQEAVAKSDADWRGRQLLEGVLRKFNPMFTEKPGRTDILLHRIDTGDSRPIRCNPRPLSAHKQKQLDAALGEMIETGAVRESNSPWAFPIVLAPKKDGTARLCVDYRRLNAVTVRDAYPFPAIDSIMYVLGNSRVFTTLDCSRGFLQIAIHPDDVPKTAFTCSRGLFEFVRLPFGLSNSPASFQRVMDTILADVKHKFAMAYMDDVIVFSNTIEEHVDHLNIVLQKLWDAGLTIHPGKVQLASSRVNLLGFVVDNGQLLPNQEKLQAITEYPPPHNVKSLQRFLGMVGFYRQFIPHCAEVSRPLNKLLQKGVRWTWGQEQQTAFMSLTLAIAKTASLQLPDLNKDFVLQTDASDCGLGAVLLQEHGGVLKPVAFASHTLTPAERNYSVTERECLAIVFALKKFDMYLDGARFEIQTDHQALSWLKKLPNPAGRLARWSLLLDRYHYTIVYKKGSTNIVADALSRAPLGVDDTQIKEVAVAGPVQTASDSRWGTIITRDELREAQQADSLCRQISESLEPAAPVDDKYDSYRLSEDGVLLRYIPKVDDDSDESPFRVVVPRKLRKRFIQYFHDSALGGHNSGCKTFTKLSRVATWSGVRGDCLKYAKSCPTCQKSKPRGGKPPGLLQSIKSQHPWQIAACDVMGPFPRSPSGNQYLLVVTDHFSKWVELFPLRKLTSQKVWDCLLETFTMFGFPAQLVTDNASYFTSKIFADTCKSLGITHKPTSPYNPQANITERVNRNLKMALIANTERHKDWDAKLKEIAFAQRTTVNRSTGFTPAYLNFGRDVAFPLDNQLVSVSPEAGQRSFAKFAQDTRKRLSDAVREARENLDVARLQQAAQYDKGRRDLQFKVGDLVLKRTHPLSDAARGFAASLAKRWDGPYEVIEKLSRLSYRLKHCQTGQQLRSIHMNDLKRFFPPEYSPQDAHDAESSSSTSTESPAHRYNLRRRTKGSAIA